MRVKILLCTFSDIIHFYVHSRYMCHSNQAVIFVFWILQDVDIFYTAIKVSSFVISLSFCCDWYPCGNVSGFNPSWRKCQAENGDF